MAKDKVTHNKIEYFGIATYQDVNDTIGYNTFTGDTSQCLSDTVANTKNFIGYPGKPTKTGKLLAFVNLDLLKKVKLTIKTNNTYGIKFNWIKIYYLRKQNNTYTEAKTETVFSGAIIDKNISLSVDIISPHFNDPALYGVNYVPPSEKAVKIEISPSIIYGSGSGKVYWDTDKYTDPNPNNKYGKELGKIANNQPPLSYTFDLLTPDPFAFDQIKMVPNPYWPDTSTECTIMFDSV